MYFIPDALHDHTVTTDKTTYIFKNAFIQEAKFTTGNAIKLEQTYNVDQIKGFIDYLSTATGVVINGVPTNDKISDYGQAALVFITPWNVNISDEIINYAKEKNVAVLKRVAVAVTDWMNTAQQSKEQQAIENNELKFTRAYMISPSVNKKIGSDLYKQEAQGSTESGSNVYGDGVEVDWSKK